MSAVKSTLVEAYVCPDCLGTGEITRNPNPNYNPQLDTSEPCPYCINGLIPADAIPSEHHHTMGALTWMPTLPTREPAPRLFPEGSVEHDLPW